MVGIAGFLDWKRDAQGQTDLFDTLSKSLFDQNELEERRAIQDTHIALTASSWWSRDDVTVAVDGYLYNQKELQADLQQAGHRVQSGQVAELLQLAYLHWGDWFVERIAGAFAFVLWDSREQRLLLGRDPLGVKTLFYADRDGAVPLGSKIKTVLEHPAVTRQVQADGLVEVLVKGPNYTPGHAVFADVREVLPGHIVVCTSNGMRSICYWKLESHPHEDSVEETVSTIDAMLNSHVSQWSELAVPPTVILSGGLDSSGLMAMMHRAFGGERQGWKSFSGNTAEALAMENAEDLDYPWVKRVSEFLGVPNEEVLYDLSRMQESNHLPRHAHDLPTMAKYETMTYKIFKHIREQNRMVVLGEAADELFSSLPWFYQESHVGDAGFPWRNPKSALFASKGLLQSIRAEEYLQERSLDYLAQVPRLAGEDGQQARARELSYLTIKDYLPYVTKRNDRMSAAADLELRMPFFDSRLAQYVWNIPREMKNYRNQPKGILRQVFRAYLPDDVIDRKKSTSPLAFSLAYSSYLHQEAERLLEDTQAPLYDLLDREQIRKVLEERGIQDDLYMRWRLDYYLQINHWMREYRVELRV